MNKNQITPFSIIHGEVGMMHDDHSITECEDRKCRLPEESREERWKNVIGELRSLAGDEMNVNLGACADMSAGGLQQFLRENSASDKKSASEESASPRKMRAGVSGSAYPDSSEWYLTKNEVEALERRDYLGAYKSEVEMALRLAEYHFKNKILVQGCIQAIQRETERVKSLLKIDF